MIAMGMQRAWIGTGAGLAARVFRTADRGRTWSVAETPVVHGATSAGIFSVSFRDSLHGMVVGGDNGNADGYTDNEIASELFVSSRTVQNHLTRIREKSGLRRRAELTRWAIEHALM